jgi:transcriptional regulatory protein RtcR
MKRKPLVVIGMLGTTLDGVGRGPKRWDRWRPTLALCQHEDLRVDRLELLYPPRVLSLAEQVADDVRQVAPETQLVLHPFEVKDPWDLGEVYGALHDFARTYPFDTDAEDYLVHITTGTHIVQICMFLLTESRHLPARLVQTAPPTQAERGHGSFTLIDLDLSKYDRLASRFEKEAKEASSVLKSGIETRNAAYNRLIDRIEQVALKSRDPLLLCGPTGSGKSRLARRIYDLKKARRQVKGELVEFNCATLRGDGAMSTLFGHVKGAFTGALEARPGLLKKADQGVLFLDEIGELPLDEQAMLLSAIEKKVFYPVGSDREVKSDFLLLAGTNRDLGEAVRDGRFREDLLARINIWTFALPGLRERPEDLEPNLAYELEESSRVLNRQVTFSREARERYLRFARSPEALWAGNFRDFSASIRRLTTLAESARVSVNDVEEEIERLRQLWRSAPARAAPSSEVDLRELLGKQRAAELDPFDGVQLREVVATCRASRTLSEAGRKLFAVSRQSKTSTNDADRLRKYLARFGLDWDALNTG